MQLFEWPALGWLALAIAAAIVEVSIPHFGFLFVAVGAVAGAVASAAGASGAGQVAVFSIVVAVSLALVRPHLVSRLRSRGVPSRTDSLIGHEAVVTYDIESMLGNGRVNVGGEDWAARSKEVLAAGTRVRVVAADGIVLEVTRA